MKTLASILIWISFLSSAAISQTRTTPQPPKFENNHIERTDLASEVPFPIERFQYSAEGTYAGKTFHPVEVPLWSFSSGRYQVGTLAVGSPVVLEFVQGIGGRNYYGFRQEVKRGEESFNEVVWIDGRFVKIAGEN